MTKPAFVFRDRISFWWPVIVRLPEDGGAKEATFDAEFLMLPENELFEARSDAAEPEAEPSLMVVLEGDRKRLRKIWIGMKGVQNDRGGEVEFDEASRDAMLSHRHIRHALNDAYNAAMLGQLEERSGN